MYTYIHTRVKPTHLNPTLGFAHSQVNYLMESLYLPDPKPPVGIIGLIRLTRNIDTYIGR